MQSLVHRRRERRTGGEGKECFNNVGAARVGRDVAFIQAVETLDRNARERVLQQGKRNTMWREGNHPQRADIS